MFKYDKNLQFVQNNTFEKKIQIQSSLRNLLLSFLNVYSFLFEGAKNEEKDVSSKNKIFIKQYQKNFSQKD